MTCAEEQAAASDYIDGTLPPTTLARMERHLAWCAPCSAFIATLRLTVTMVRSLPHQHAPRDLKQRVLRATQEKQE